MYNFLQKKLGKPPRCLNKLLLVMKITSFIITAVILQVSASSFAQKITLSKNNASLLEVFAQIKAQTGYDFLFNASTLKDSKRVNVNISNMELKDALDKVFEGQQLAFSIENKSVVVSRKTPSFLDKILGSDNSNLRGVIDVKGKVLNENGQPLSGALIKKKSDSRGVTTDAGGNFFFKGIDEKDMLIISYLGYATQEIKPSASPIIYMKLTTNALDQVVIQAYGTTSNRLRTGNIATVTAAEIERRPVTNVLTALQGKVAGLEIKASSGHESGGFKVEIRGRKFLNDRQNPDPLYIVDGVPLTVLEFNNTGSPDGGNGFLQGGIDAPQGIRGQSPLFSLNPNDIESVTVLKDADATAIYGSRGGSGVIVITTKKGKIGKTQLEASFTSGISKVPKFYDLMDTKEYVAMRKEAFQNDRITPEAWNAGDLVVWDTTRYTDWQRLLYGGTGKRNIAQLNLTGGHNQMTFRLGGNFTRTTGVNAVSGGVEKASLQSNLSHTSLNNKLNLSFTNIFSYQKVNEINYMGGLALLAPNAPPIFNQAGKLNYKEWNPVTSFPFGELGNPPYESKSNFLNSQLQVKYQFVKKLQFTANIGYSSHLVNQVRVNTIASQDPELNPTGSSGFGNSQGQRWIVEPQFNFQTELSKGRLDIMTGVSLQKTSQEGSSSNGSGYVNDNLLYSVANAPLTSTSNFRAQYNYAAIFGRITYNWADQYIINLSARRDGSSRFGPNKQYGNFAAVGLAWIFTENKFFENHFKWLSLGKLRASYGTAGSDGVGDYSFLSRWTANTSIVTPYQGVTSYAATQHFNPNLQWQRNKKIEVALQLGFLNDKISVELVNYKDRCGNQLANYPLSIITGFSGVLANIPATVENSGYEATVTTNIVDKKDFSVSLNFNIGGNKNKLIAFPNLEQSPYYLKYFVGRPLNLSSVFHYTGIDPQTGLYTVEDLDKDGAIRYTRDKILNDKYLRNYNIRFAGGFGMDFRYKSLNANLFFSYVRKPFEISAIFNGIPGTFGFGTDNQSTQLLNRWQNPGDQALFARYTTMSNSSDTFFQSSDGVYSDASFIKLNNASLSYDLPNKVAKKIGVGKFNVFVRCENIFTISRYNGLDPEMIYLGLLPQLRTITVGVNVNL
ncbi:TonB-linked SusC/RagA family outer membrane protein [Pedobacter sp. AK017]|uniref:SusC/RagA family TonB-linked outer membrane protein n=1 Tax=Pedobacter sp. AK017 TaxID=2723073 RepID=UPI00160F27DE|nr:SusC/RagA family TonB-linked outer membrane protein [Pedobacter sp. AK017]MBB5439391.1 TonB-linked SusC/RagA family outer membrane protein [Pedobacter sp. AK017]